MKRFPKELVLKLALKLWETYLNCHVIVDLRSRRVLLQNVTHKMKNWQRYFLAKRFLFPVQI